MISDVNCASLLMDSYLRKYDDISLSRLTDQQILEDYEATNRLQYKV